MFAPVEAKKMSQKAECVSSIGRHMNFEQRANIKFCFKLGKSFTETFNLMKKVYCNDALSRTRVYEWYKRFRDGRVDINDDEHPGAKKSVVTDRNMEVVRDFITKEPKCSLRYMEGELNISKNAIHRILTQHLGLRKICARFVPHQLTDDQKALRIRHCKDLLKSSKNNKKFIYSIVTGDETWCFQYDPETKRQSAEWKHPNEEKPTKSRLEKSKVKTMLICFYDSEGILHKEFLPTGQTMNGVFYVGVLKRLLLRIRRVRPQYREKGSWRLLQDNAPSHRSKLVTDFLTNNDVLTINHSPYSPDLAPCDFYLFSKLHLPMKGQRYADIESIQKASTAILKDIPKVELRNSFDTLIDRAKRCIEANGSYFE